MDIGLLGIFGAGFLALFTPCVLPLVPIYLATLMGGSAASAAQKSRLVTRAVLFSLGFVLVFVALGMSASFAGGFIAENRSVFMGIGAVLILLFGLKFLHVIEIPILERSLSARGPDMSRGAVATKSLLLGAAFAAGWSPCIGPVLGAVLTYTALETSNPLEGALYLGVFGLGLTTPLVAIAAFADRMQRLVSRAGKYFRPVEIALGGILLVIAVGMGQSALTPSGQAGPCEHSLAQAAAPAAAGPEMIFFSSPDCPVCRRMKPLVEDLARRCVSHSVSMRIIDVTAPENSHYRERYRLLGVPTFVFLDAQGRETARLVGEQTEQTLLQAASVLAGRPCPGVTALDDRGGPAPGVACDLGAAPSQSRLDALAAPQCPGG